MRINLKGIHHVRARLSDGRVECYFYAWRGGPRINALPGTPDFLRQYNEAHASIRKPQAGTLMSLVAEYKSSSDFKRLAAKTAKDYLRYIRLIEDEFGDMPIAALDDRRVRGEFKTWRDRFADTPRKADYCWTTLSKIFSFCKDRGLIASNPCEGGGCLYAVDRTESIWEETHVAAFLSTAAPELGLALMLALWTGQRQGDLLRLPWSAFDGARIRLKQSKTGRRVVIPAGTPLRALLERTERRNPMLLTNQAGRPWTSDGFRTSWGKAARASGITGLTFHDLRGTAVSRLALAGASVAEIATITGHSLRDVDVILDAHYPHRDAKLAESAIVKLEARTNL